MYREVVDFLVLVAVSDIDCAVPSLIVEIIGSWPLEGSHNNYSVAHRLSTFCLVFGTVSTKANNPGLYFRIFRHANCLV